MTSVPQVLNNGLFSFLSRSLIHPKNVATHWTPVLEILHILCIRELPYWRTILLLSNPILNAGLLKLSFCPLECMISSGIVNCRCYMVGSVRCCNVIRIWLSEWTTKFSRCVIKTSWRRESVEAALTTERSRGNPSNKSA